ncbi:hypothetical protein NL676_027923 [Syzygium grande]|nr:hypothetical protein NL676_027923 [Syzygium grande]
MTRFTRISGQAGGGGDANVTATRPRRPGDGRAARGPATWVRGVGSTWAPPFVGSFSLEAARVHVAARRDVAPCFRSRGTGVGVGYSGKTAETRAQLLVQPNLVGLGLHPGLGGPKLGQHMRVVSLGSTAVTGSGCSASNLSPRGPEVGLKVATDRRGRERRMENLNFVNIGVNL